VIDNENGYIVDPRNVIEVTDKIEQLLKNKELRIQMGEKGKERFLQHYTLEKFEDRMHLTFQSLVRSNLPA
jgi:glycosyltransferase involved in cell wall biosynthesis